MIMCRMSMTKLIFSWVSLYPLPHHSELNGEYTILQYHTSGGFCSMMHMGTGLLSPLA